MACLAKALALEYAAAVAVWRDSLVSDSPMSRSILARRVVFREVLASVLSAASASVWFPLPMSSRAGRRETEEADPSSCRGALRLRFFGRGGGMVVGIGGEEC